MYFVTDIQKVIINFCSDNNNKLINNNLKKLMVMKTNDSNKTRSEHAKNEKRDADGRFTSSSSSSKSSQVKNEKKSSGSHSQTKK